MGEPLTVVTSIAKDIGTPRPPVENPPNEYDNFYSPENKGFYSTIHYMRFKPEDHKIRLLRIRPLKDDGTMQSPIEADLVDNQSLAAIQGKFTTLSYCAGSPRNTETILVNGRKFNAFANLGHALRIARNFWKEKHGAAELLLWADQVCINQSDVNERSHQVNFMGDIYESAMQVLVCLSVEGSHSGGIRWLQQLHDKIAHPCDGEEPGFKRTRRLLFHGFKNVDFHSGWDGFLATVMLSPWWPRAWIRQEFIKSPNAYFLAGDEIIHYKSLQEDLSLLGDTLTESCFVQDQRCPLLSRTPSNMCLVCSRDAGSDTERKLKDRLECALELFRLKEILSPPEMTRVLFETPEGYKDLLACLSYMYLCEASDPRDLVYACLGLTAHTYRIHPNYASNFSFHDLLVHVAQSAIKHDQSLNAILLTARSTVINRAPGLPSWVPDFRVKPSLRMVHMWMSDKIPKTRSFSFHADGEGQPGRTLQVCGVAMRKDGDEWVLDVSSESKQSKPSAYDENRREVYLIHGALNVHIFRRRNQYLELTREDPTPNWGYYNHDEISDTALLQRYEQLNDMVQTNHPKVEVLRIC